MYHSRIHCLILLAALCSGCSQNGIFAIGARNLKYEACRIKDDNCDRLRDYAAANAAWDEFVANHPEIYSQYYEEGFKKGFKEYIDGGGTADYSPIPPFRYQRIKNETPEGHANIEEWYQGRQQGFTAAKEGGYRQWTKVPIAPLPPPPPPIEYAPPRAPSGPVVISSRGS